MITALHALVYSDDPTATRAFFKDVLRWPFVADGSDSQDPAEWLIFRTGPSELGVHPTSGTHEGTPYSSSRHHAVSLVCDDLGATMAELAGRGAEFRGEPQDMGFGLAVLVQVPGADDILLYQPQHTTAFDLT